MIYGYCHSVCVLPVREKETGKYRPYMTIAWLVLGLIGQLVSGLIRQLVSG
jgi:hypothetical protein